MVIKVMAILLFGDFMREGRILGVLWLEYYAKVVALRDISATLRRSFL